MPPPPKWDEASLRAAADVSMPVVPSRLAVPAEAGTVDTAAVLAAECPGLALQCTDPHLLKVPLAFEEAPAKPFVFVDSTYDEHAQRRNHHVFDVFPSSLRTRDIEMNDLVISRRV